MNGVEGVGGRGLVAGRRRLQTISAGASPSPPPSYVSNTRRQHIPIEKPEPCSLSHIMPCLLHKIVSLLEFFDKRVSH